MLSHVEEVRRVAERARGPPTRGDPLPKSPCEGEERRACLGQALPTGSPIVGPRVSPYRGYRGQLTCTAVDASNVKVSDDDVYLSRNMTFEANNRIVKELSELGSVETKHSQLQAKKRGGAQPTAVKKKKVERAKFYQSCR